MNQNSNDLPQIPDKRYFTIGEVSQLCAVKPHVLRYWEQEFKQLKPSKRRGNRRYYQHKDVLMIRHIRNLLYDKGFTIGGARQQLSNEKQHQEEPHPEQPPKQENFEIETPMPQSISTHDLTTPTASSDMAFDNKFLQQCLREIEEVINTLKEV